MDPAVQADAEAERERLRILRARMAGLQACSLLPGSADKRMIREICCREPATLSDRQAALIERLAWRYRRQLPAGVAPAEEPPPLPPKPEKRWADKPVRGNDRRRGIAP